MSTHTTDHPHNPTATVDIHVAEPLGTVMSLLESWLEPDDRGADEPGLDDLCAAIEEYDDCFYGWGESKDGPACMPHTVLRAINSRDFDPNDVARYLQSWAIQHGNEGVVVTDHEDWSIVCAGAHTPIIYTADHTH